MNNKVKCSVCGAEMDVSIEMCTGKPFRLQMCSDACMLTAFGIVTKALKRGVRPNFNPKEKPTSKKKGRNLTTEERQQIVKMYTGGMKKADIARKVKRTAALVGQVIKKELGD